MKLGRAGLGVVLFCFCLGFCQRSVAQVYSQNIVGYVNQLIYAGNNLVANQFDYNGDNSLNTILRNSTPEGATFTKWDAAGLTYLPLSTYDVNGGWSINYDLTYGEGGVLDSPSAFTNTFAGSVWPGFSGNGPFTPPLVSGTGLLLLSCMIPIGNAGFYDVVGRGPADGEFVTTLNPLTQLGSTTTFRDGVWDNGDPLLAVGQPAFFGLGGLAPSAVIPVPEPATFGLLGAGVLALAGLRSLRRRNQ